MKKHDCRVCKKNEMGICCLTNKEVPISYMTGRNQGVPRFCPFKEKKK